MARCAGQVGQGKANFMAACRLGAEQLSCHLVLTYVRAKEIGEVPLSEVATRLCGQVAVTKKQRQT